ncbi:MAG: amino acid regulated cytosolic protein [Bradyrhizobiaceae bacterium]|nr:MAG: amino acid regulated cytosolic protein [Bradyrhizobiaceae bacterium]
MPSFRDIADDVRNAAQALIEYGSQLAQPTVRLGVTGLSGAGKTVFITALVHHLLHGGRLPVFEAFASGRIAGARLEPQPDDAVPRFDYEAHANALLAERRWPESTRQVSELRLAIDYQSARGRERTLTLDIVDYPGEWLLDLPLLRTSYAEWAAATLTLSRTGARRALAAGWHAHLATLRPDAPEDEQQALAAARLFTDYLRACRDQRYAMSLLPPGRFLMPGDLAGAPALAFAPLEAPGEQAPGAGSLWSMMERRYEAYKSVVVRPFFRDHFARLDRQIVLIDALAAFNAGPEAVSDLERALAAILACFRSGRATWTSALFRPRIDRILFAATKADHLHHTSHDPLERILSRMTAAAIARAEFAGAAIDVVALAAVRATREAQVARGRERLPAIIGTPIAGESVGGETFDGAAEVAAFPGDLPEDPEVLFTPEGAFKGTSAGAIAEADFRFLRFRPPRAEAVDGSAPLLPHIRLDRALQFLLGDRLA